MRKFSRFRLSTTWPRSSRTVASTTTRFTSTFNLNPPVLGVAGRAGLKDAPGTGGWVWSASEVAVWGGLLPEFESGLSAGSGPDWLAGGTTLLGSSVGTGPAGGKGGGGLAASCG